MIKRILFIITMLIVPIAPIASQTAQALSPSQRLEIERRPWYDPTDVVCDTDTNPGASSSATSTASGKVYMIGDSITHGAQTQLDTALKGAGYSTVVINGVDSRSLSEGGSPLNGITVFSNDKDKWKDASSIIIELGTNGGLTASNIGKIITILQQGLVSPSTKVYWVNIGVINAKRSPSQPLNSSGWNKTLSDNSSKGYTVIDWASVMKDQPEYIASDNLGVHPAGPGIDVFAKTVADGSKNLSTTAPINTADMCCDYSATIISTPTTPLTGADYAQKIFNFLISKGLTKIQAAGIMGNIQAESGFNPNLEEKTNRASKGFGIVQWTFGRRTALESAARAAGVPASDLTFQLNYMWQELTTSYKSKVYEPLKSSTSLEQATYIWLEHYEIPANIPKNKPIRLGFAQNIANQPWAQVGATTTTTTDDTLIGSSSDIPTCNPGTISTGGSVSAIIANATQEFASGANEANGQYLKYTDGAKEAWCADFVSWILKQSGVPFTGGASGGWRLPSAASVKDYFVKNNTYHPARQGYVPQPGDIAVHSPGNINHVNIVIAIDGQKITTIGGNESNKIGKRTVESYDDNDFDGFGTPITK